MKRWFRIIALVMSLMFVQVCVLTAAEPLQVEAAAKKKNGLKKENGKIYFYKDGKKVKNQWRTVKEKIKSGKTVKTVSYKYYFGKDGAAYQGKKKWGIEFPVLKKIKEKKFAFDLNGHMLTGIQVMDYKFYFFNKTGVYNAAKTGQYRSVAKVGKNFKNLRKLLGKPKKEVVSPYPSCFGDGKDVSLYYSGFIVDILRKKNGTELFVSLTRL